MNREQADILNLQSQVERLERKVAELDRKDRERPDFAEQLRNFLFNAAQTL